ncbi:MAG: asparagine synthase (glutamine-hydrolyzing) [Acidobacteriota bacterium]
MCGIAGFAAPGESAAAEARRRLEAMTATLGHRGPDGEGLWLEAPVGLGHRRLSIVDLEGGAQPMGDASGRVQVSFNGEIYNHLELRAELGGERFRTRCDTEVLIEGWKEWGEGLFSRLNGMFALALWDAREQTLILARDRLGQKPLYTARLPNGGLAFASEPKALLAHPEVSSEPDLEALVRYLTLEYFPADRTPFAAVQKLPPGHLLRWSARGIEIEAWWRLPAEDRETPPDVVEHFRDLFDRAVERRLMSDVPLGVFLSGGLDSSAVVASMTAARPPETVDTFAIGFDEQSFDETPYARRVARHLGTRHHEKRFRVSDLRDVLPRILGLLDEPFGDPSLLPTYLLCAFAREHVTVALSGDAGDELFLGYAPFSADWAARWYRRTPSPLRSLAERAIARWPVDARNFSPQFVAERFVRGGALPDADRHPIWIGSALPGGPDDPVRPDVRRAVPWPVVLEPSREAFAASRHRSAPQRIGHQYCLTYLPEDILYKVDRASMMRSLEVRSPFLDVEIVDMAARLPLHWKRRGRTSKVLLRQAMSERLPAEILKRPKKGFGIPVAAWLRGPLRDLLCDTLAAERIVASPILEPAVVARLVDEHVTGRRNHAKILWTLLMYQTWQERFAPSSRAATAA